MASLIEEELARRDAESGRPVVTARTSYVPARDRQRQAELDYRRQHDADTMAAREAMMANKEGTAALRETHAALRDQAVTDRLELSKKEFEVNSKIRELDEKAKSLALDQKLEQLNRTQSRMDAADTYFKEVGQLDPHAPDFETKYAALTRRTLAAADHPAVEASRKHLIGEIEKKNAYDMLWAPKPEKPQNSGKAPFGTEKVGVGIGPDGKPTSIITRPLPDPNSPEGRTRALQQQHDTLQAQLKDAKGNYLTGDAAKAKIDEINAVKSKLGYALIDPAHPEKTLDTAPAPAAAPVVPVTAPVTAPVVTAPAGDAVAIDGATAPDTTVAPVAVASPAPTLNPLTDDVAKAARAAIAAGKDAAAVAKRLQEAGYDTNGL